MLQIPEIAMIEEILPVEELFYLAIREGNYKKPVYQMHKWWARRFGTVFRSILIASILPKATSEDIFWSKFYSKNDFSDLLILDPFMGGGTSIVEATKCNAKTVGVDIDPIAWFLTRKEIEKCDLDTLDNAFQKIQSAVAEQIKWFYKTTDRDGNSCEVIYCFWVDVLGCPVCNFDIHLHPHYYLSRSRNDTGDIAFCSHCYKVHPVPSNVNAFDCDECSYHNFVSKGTVTRGKYTCPNCSANGRILDALVSDIPPKKYLFAIEYENPSGKRQYKRADQMDLDLYNEAEGKLAEMWDTLPIPSEPIPTENRNDPRPVNYGYKFYHQLFNARQLLGLALILNEINRLEDQNAKEHLLLAFSDSLLGNNKLCSYAFDYQKLTPLFGIHAYNMVTRTVENNVWGTKFGRGSFSKCYEKMKRGKEYAQASYEFEYSTGNAKKIYTSEVIQAEVATNIEDWKKWNKQALLLNQSSTDLSGIASQTVDLVLTDPPYFDNLAYSELSDFFYAWIKNFLPHDDRWVAQNTPYQSALFARKDQPTGYVDFTKGLSQVFAECARVLKNQGLMVFTYHHRKVEAWQSISIALRTAGLVVTKVLPVRSEGTGAFHSSEGNIKWDSVIVCRKLEQRKTPLALEDLESKIATDWNKWVTRLSNLDEEFGNVDALSFALSTAVWEISKYRDLTDSAIKEILLYAENYAQFIT